MCASGRNTEVEFRHEQTRTAVQSGSGNRRNGGNRRRARCCSPGSDRSGRPRRGDSPRGLSETLGEAAALPIHITPQAQLQLDIADAWWQVNRIAAPNAIDDDFRSMAAILARTPGIGRRATNTRTRNVRQMFLRRVGFVIYYRVIGSPLPHFSHAEWNCRHPVDSETWDDLELCERFVLGSTSNRESFSPSAFQLGEKVAKPDEGAFHEDVIREPSSVLGPASVNREYLVKRPPHPPSAPSPPARNRGGRRALDEGSGKALKGTIQVSV